MQKFKYIREYINHLGGKTSDLNRQDINEHDPGIFLHLEGTSDTVYKEIEKFCLIPEPGTFGCLENVQCIITEFYSNTDFKPFNEMEHLMNFYNGSTMHNVCLGVHEHIDCYVISVVEINSKES